MKELRLTKIPKAQRARSTPLDDPNLADYRVSGDGIYLRDYNVKVAQFSENTTALRDKLNSIFERAAKRAGRE